MQTGNSYPPEQVDYKLHDFIRVRLLDASPQDVRIVTRQLGALQTPRHGEPDIVIQFVDFLPVSQSIRYLGVDDSGFTDDAFLVLRSKHKTRAKVQMSFSHIGQPPFQIICERGLPAVPLLIPILNLIALSKGVLPMHASAFRYQGQGILTTGWSKGGKTETLLAFMAKGAEYIGDEWVYISHDGRCMYGIPEPIRVWDWHLHDLPQCRAQIGRKEQMRLRLLKFMLRSMEGAAAPKLGASRRFIGRLTPLVKQQLHVDIAPQQLFNQKMGTLADSLDKVLFVVSQESPEVTVRPIDPQEVAQRMVFSLQAERMDFMSYYLKFRFAFPEACNALIDHAEERQRTLLSQVFTNKETYAIHHPYPVAIPALFDAINPFLQGQS